MILLSVAPLLASVTTIVTCGFAHHSLVTVSRHLFLLGLFAFFYVLSITFISSHFGVGKALFFFAFGTGNRLPNNWLVRAFWRLATTTTANVCGRKFHNGLHCLAEPAGLNQDLTLRQFDA